MMSLQMMILSGLFLILLLFWLVPKYVRMMGNHFGKGIFDHINKSVSKFNIDSHKKSVKTKQQKERSDG